MKYKLAIIGAGPWAEMYCKNIATMPEIELVAMARREDVRPLFIPDHCKLYTNAYRLSVNEKRLQGWEEMISTEKLDGIIIATSRPWEQTDKCLRRGIPTLCEKPGRVQAKNMEYFIEKTNNKKIIFGHQHIFSDAFQELKRIVAGNKIIRICSSGFGPSKTRKDFSPLWDYGPHDLSMILSLIDSEPTEIDIKSHNETKAGHSFRINLRFGDIRTKSIVGNGTIVKSRYFSVTYEQDGKENFITYDDMSIDKLFFNGKPWAFERTDTPIKNSLNSFIGLIDGKHDDRYGAELTAKITKILGTYEEN